MKLLMLGPLAGRLDQGVWTRGLMSIAGDSQVLSGGISAAQAPR